MHDEPVNIVNITIQCRKCRKEGSFEEIERHNCPAIIEEILRKRDGRA